MKFDDTLQGDDASEWAVATMTLLMAYTALLTVGQDPTPQVPAPAPQDPSSETRTFSDPALGLSFSHPASWVPIAQATLPGKKPKKPIEGTVEFSIPSADGGTPAELTIVRATFSDAPEKWQQLQADANRNLKRAVERQWQQEILGVPLLLTRIGFNQDGVAKTTVTGLLYNAAPYKLLFRLTGPAASFDGAQYQFTQAMETLRTTNDALPATQEPGKPIDPPTDPTKPDAKHPLFVKQKVDPKAAPVSLNVSVGGRKMLLRVPEAWTLEKVEGDSATLRNPAVASPITVKFFPVATAPRPVDALTEASNITLNEFTTVALREDTPGTPNKAGNPVLAIWRRGTKTSGPHAAMDAVAVTGDYYLLFSGRPTAGTTLTSERKVIQAMLNAVGFEPAP